MHVVTVVGQVFVVLSVAAMNALVAGIAVHLVRNRSVLVWRNVWHRGLAVGPRQLQRADDDDDDGDGDGGGGGAAAHGGGLPTRSASNIGMPLDLRSLRQLFAVACCFQTAMMLASIYLEWISIYLIFVPLFGLISALLLSAFGCLVFLFMDGTVVMGISYFCIVAMFLGCDYLSYPIPRVEDLCWRTTRLTANVAATVSNLTMVTVPSSDSSRAFTSTMAVTNVSSSSSGPGDDDDGGIRIGVYVATVVMCFIVLVTLMGHTFLMRLLRFKLYLSQTGAYNTFAIPVPSKYSTGHKPSVTTPLLFGTS
eukprot:TRINITY_DN3141_c0_g2_i1.p1 TRINITY_DN3141_c0_g2~~TRINITY_DN3141_c0_g2_i1.p1  ORF type:complete len:309 (-),score=86.18 TRINITY_DN3141_c0_g2_i1:117-1043(-)